MNLPSLLWALGFVCVGFGLVNFGIGLFGGSGVVDLGWILGNLALGLMLLVAAAVSNLDALRERMSSGEARRAGKYGTSALLSTALLLVIIGTLGFLSTRYHERVDLSEQKVHSLTSQSVQVLENLENDVDVLALFAPLDAEPVRDLLDRYAYVSDRFRVEVADPNERPELLARYEITPEQLGSGVVRVALGDESVLVDEVTEEKITNAIVKLSRSGEKKVYFLQGHNERAISGDGAASREGFQRAAEALGNENYTVDSLLLAATGEVPEDADVVVVGGATRPLLASEREALDRYVEHGGALLVLVDPRANTDLVDDLRKWGVDVGEDVIVDRLRALFGQPTSPIVVSYSKSHDITKDMREEPTLFDVVRSVRSAKKDEFTEIAFTADTSWAERDLDRFYGEGAAELDDADLPGPVAVAVAGTLPVASNGDAPAGAGDDAEEGESGQGDSDGARLVVFGDADFASNKLIEAYRNRDLFVNSVNWLMGDVEAISIRPSISRASRFQLTQKDFLRIRTLSLFVLPQLIAVLGVFVWWSRRRSLER
jgi:ABC-type uncharacterized transport system involved in gliding motility auxiliary subunit